LKIFKRIRCLEWIYHFLHLSYRGNGRHFHPLKGCNTLRWIFGYSY
jgi:hypothetical protein